MSAMTDKSTAAAAQIKRLRWCADHGFEDWKDRRDTLNAAADLLTTHLAEPAAEGREAQPLPARMLWDSQWTNCVNHARAYEGWATEDAVSHAVTMAEDYIRGNIERGEIPAALATHPAEASAQGGEIGWPPPFEMRLCEQNHVILKPNRVYVFTVDQECDECRRLAAACDPAAFVGTPAPPPAPERAEPALGRFAQMSRDTLVADAIAESDAPQAAAQGEAVAWPFERALAAAIEGLAKATPGLLDYDSTRNDACYGDGGPDSRRGFDSYALIDEKGLTLFDSLNSDCGEIEEACDDDAGLSAWDEKARRNAIAIVACWNFMREHGATINPPTPADLVARLEGLAKAAKDLDDAYCEVSPDMDRATRHRHREVLIRLRAALAGVGA